MIRCILSATVVASCLVGGGLDHLWAAAPMGGFMAHLNQQNTTGFSDSRRSVTYYSDDIAAGPLFSVHIPGENVEFGQFPSYNGEELDAIATDPLTGDTYILAFDSTTGGMVGDTETNFGTGALDTLGDFDLYRIDFRAAYEHWSSTFQGQMAAGMPGVGGPAPFVPAGAPAGAFNDYVTYGVGPVDSLGNFDPVEQSHSNAFVLPGVVEKIGEVKRNDGGNFFDVSLDFINSSTLVMIDDSAEPAAADTAAGDHAYRILERVSTSPGGANDSSADFLDGGFNNGTTESWNSRRIGLVNLDFNAGQPFGHSEPESIAFHADPVSGVRGFWVTESDSSAITRGDDIAFYEIDSSGNGVGYRPHAVGGGPDFPTSFQLDNDPFNDSSANDGQADHIFVDSDTGDIIIIESGFGDAGIASIGADHEPSVIRREVLSYDDGEGRIQFGAWSQKLITTPNKDPGDTFLERGIWAAYNSEQDLVYFLSPGGGGETPAFQNDIIILDVNTGLTTTVNNIDESVALFFSDSIGDVADYFFIPPIASSPGDFNADGVVDAADYTVWRDNLGSSDALGGNGDESGLSAGVVDEADYALWRINFGMNFLGNAAGATPVPEPTGCLLALAVVALAGVTRRRD